MAEAAIDWRGHDLTGTTRGTVFVGRRHETVIHPVPGPIDLVSYQETVAKQSSVSLDDADSGACWRRPGSQLPRQSWCRPRTGHPSYPPRWTACQTLLRQ